MNAIRRNRGTCVLLALMASPAMLAVPPRPALQPSRVAPGDPVHGKQISPVCAVCHDDDGRTRFGIYPRIAGQTYEYLFTSMKEFRLRERHQQFASQMWAPLTDLSDQDLRDLAAYYARLPW